MTDRQEILKRLAAARAVIEIASGVEKDAKAALQRELPRGTEYLYDSEDVETRRELGYATVPKPSVPKPSVSLTVEEILPWLMETWPDAVELRPTIQEWARKDIEAAALRLYAAGEELQPGVSVTVAAPKAAAARFTPSKDLVDLVRGMWERGELDLVDVLAIEPVRPGDAA